MHFRIINWQFNDSIVSPKWMKIYFVPTGIYLLKVNSRNTRTMYEIGIAISIDLVSLLLTLSIFHTLF